MRTNRILRSAVILMLMLAFAALVAPMPAVAEGPLTATPLGCKGGCYTESGCIIYALICGIAGLTSFDRDYFILAY